MEDHVKPAADDQAALSTLVQWYEAAEQATADSRQECERDRDYYDNKQWTAEEIATLKKRKQPIVTINRIKPKVNFLLGMEQQRRADPKAFPRTPADEEGANAATDGLRYVMDDQRWDRTRSKCFNNHVVEGTCGVDVRVYEKKQGDYCIEVLPIMWDRMWWDPHSRAEDFSDAKYLGQFAWMDEEDALAIWPDAGDVLNSTMNSGESSEGQTHDDVPRTRWCDPKRKRVRIATCYSKEDGKVFYSAFTKAGVLERIESPYVTEDGEPEGGFIFASCFVDRDGNRYGPVRDWISIQDEINKRRSKAMHLMNVRQTYGNQTIGDKNKLRTELARPDGHVEMQGGAKFGEDFGVLPTGDMAKAQFDLLQEAKSEIDAVGVNAALSGTEQRVMSGRALMAKSEQGLNELGPVFDTFKQFQLDVYRKVWNRIRQFWTQEKWIRVTDDERNVRFVGLNQPMTLGEQLLEEAQRQGQEITPQMQQQAQMDPAMQQIVGVRNNVAQLDVDIVIDDVPATAALQIEQFEALTQMAGAGVPIPPDVIIEASSLRNKDRILERMRGQGQQVPPEVQQQMGQMQEALQATQQQLAEMQMQLRDKSNADAIKARETEIKAYDAETKRFAAVSSAEAAAHAAQAAPAASLQTSSDVSK